MSTFVGVRIEGGFLEVGLKALTRRQYEEHQRVIAAAVDLLWPPGTENAYAPPPDLSRDPAEGPTTEDFIEPPVREEGYVEAHLRRERAWRERQGL